MLVLCLWQINGNKIIFAWKTNYAITVWLTVAWAQRIVTLSWDLVYIPVQVTPFPVYPVLQVQVKLPTVLSQVAWSWQLSVPSVHSSTSTSSQKVVCINITDDMRKSFSTQKRLTTVDQNVMRNVMTTFSLKSKGKTPSRLCRLSSK